MNWVKVTSPAGESFIVEDCGNGEYTLWAYSIWGPFGQTGDLSTARGWKIEQISKADQAKVQRLEQMMERALKSQTALAMGMGIKGLES